ncbi:Plod [Symbiodinium sp. CCMP2592]|nr:Plod [Symbiodinium sp. CCMP2592]
MPLSWLSFASAAILLQSRGVEADLQIARSDLNTTKLHLMTFMFNMHRHFAYLQVSAEANQMFPHVLGLGKANSWGTMEKANAMRTFAFSQNDQDVMIFADAFDSLVLGGRPEILRKFEELESESGRSIVIGAEEICFPDSENFPEMTPPAKHRWRYLNSGVLVGRVHAFKKMLPEPIHENVLDQVWFQRYRRDNPDKILLDTECKLICNILSLQEDGVDVEGSRLHVRPTGTAPALVHFPGFGHRTRWVDGRPTSSLQDAFQKIFPQESAYLMEGWWFGVQVEATHDLKIYEGPGWWLLFASVLCLQCNVGGTVSDDCASLRHSEFCFWLNLRWFLLLLALAFCVLLCLSGRQGGGCPQRCQAWWPKKKPAVWEA